MKNKILITGATGYLGSCLTERLLQDGYDVIALKRGKSSITRLKPLVDKLCLIDIDNLDYDCMFKEFGDINTIIHTATCYGRTGESVTDIFTSNTYFPLRLIDAGNRAGVSFFINTDTILDKYLNLYSLSKNQLLQWGKFFSMHSNMRFVNLKLEHFYGPNDDKSKFTSHVIDGCINNIDEIKLTSGEQRRDFIYIDDVVSAYSILLKSLNNINENFSEYEVGSGQSISIKEFVEIIHRLSESSTKLKFGAIPYREGEVMNSVADISGLKKLAWNCKYDLETGLNKTISIEKGLL